MTSNTTRTRRRRKNKHRPNKENFKKEAKRIKNNLETLVKLGMS
jgi:hypothetical protein